MAMIDKVPDAVKETYLKMKGEHGKKVELKVIGGNYYLYIARGIWDKEKKKPVKRTVLFGSIDENGAFRRRSQKNIFLLHGL